MSTPKLVPAAMVKALADLAAAVQSLPPHIEGAAALAPFGNLPKPAATAYDGLSPALAAASRRLGEALASPPSLGDQWPFANPPAVQAQIDKQRAGRPPKITPHVVVRLVRFKGLGYSLAECAQKVGVGISSTKQVLAGQHPVCHSEAVRAAGISLPPLLAREAGQKVAKNSRGPQVDTKVAIDPQNAPQPAAAEVQKVGGAA